MNRTFWLKKAFKFVFFAALFIAVAGFVTQSLWNWLVPSLFHGPLISFEQTLGLLVLSRILFGGFGRGRGSWAQKRRQWKQEIAREVSNLSPEERENFRQQMQNRCAQWGRRTGAHSMRNAFNEQ
ncbi:hypothetical protein [Hymenobacter sp. BT559]|jgi:hypothetical protein|uniref:hypothetical protein n=1 Tax=Hymenobacter sp. BT559 TaxID=2795729 RepID=UPI0018EC0F09|nr:hypothetical protein [Hymenobacter sp. BT559]MBJ6142069.1 hypothetical protein [Hymenobacter sp. BT559]